jgi:outer membrane protein OmpA-like peptidoglycan-associated protein
MNRHLKLALLGSCLLTVAACAAPNREPDLTTIQTNVDKTREGDFGQFLYNLVEAENKAQAAEDIKANLSDAAPYLYTDLPLRQKGVRLSQEALDHRQKAEAAFNRILDPIRARLAYLESLHVPQSVGSQKVSVYFDTGSSKLRAEDKAKLEQAANFLSQYPIAAVEIQGYTDTQGSAASNKALAARRAAAVDAAMKKMGVPIASAISVVGVGEQPGAPDNTKDQENRRVDIVVEPHGTYNKGQ